MHNFIKKTALSLGFDACGIARAEELTEDKTFLKLWLDDGKHGEMKYLARNFEKRTDPRLLVPGCKSVVVVLMNYFPEKKQPANAPIIARYAYSEIDYHTIMKSKLNKLETEIRQDYGASCFNDDCQHLFVDSAPVLERRWAQRAGLGWIGKHTQLIASEIGSYYFIGILMLNTETEYDKPVVERCGSCRRCIDACPTRALENGSLDARRCISYLTIESKNDIPEEFQDKLSGCVWGCDICAEVCPWNKKWSVPNSHQELNTVGQITEWKKENWAQMNETEFNRIFGKSAIKRAGFRKLMKNIEMIEKTISIVRLCIK
ncbi:MAG: tRNA epoxyqueuosine(34) reductase QueG [Paludibacter sp.]|nr:tRNA epoxyqueuosine(34) reductase QueG [Paludibacter sp.]